MIIINNQ